MASAEALTHTDYVRQSSRVLLGGLVACTVGTGWWAYLAAHSTYPVWLLAVLVVATALAGWMVYSLARGRAKPAVFAAILCAVLTPTFFVYLPNILLLVVALGALFRNRSRKPVATS